MTTIQAVLVAAAVVWLVRFAARFRASGLGRIAGVAAVTIAIVLVLVPDMSASLAKVFGVGRGMDLVFYFSFAGLGFVLLHLAGRIADLETKLTDLCRRVAIDSAHLSPQGDLRMIGEENPRT